MPAKKPTKKSDSTAEDSSAVNRRHLKLQLTPGQFHRLDLACRPIREAFGRPPYLVGTAAESPNWRDVDIRLILDDKKYDRMRRAVGAKALTMMGFAMSSWLSETSGLPVDFQFQRMTEANERYGSGAGTSRNPLGVRDLRSWPGDARPVDEK